jgi:D-serine deaminase-like pyridoxal phosphate-dependent protein
MSCYALNRQILYGMPIALDKLEDAQHLANHLRPLHAQFRIMVDSLTQIQALQQYAQDSGRPESQTPWSVMIKLDGGTHRAGLSVNSDELKRAIRLCLDSPHIELFGFYAHFGRESIRLIR